jgi:TPP-dependent pyruvate/acetoin dehydrogenase alpha subunit
VCALEKELVRRKLLTEDGLKRLNRQVRREVNQALRYAAESPLPPPSEVATYVFGGPPA